MSWAWGHGLQEDQGKCPDFGVFSTGRPLPQIEFFSVGITSVLVDASDDKGDLFRIQERWPNFLLRKLVGERNEEDITNDGDNTCELYLSARSQALIDGRTYNALDDEDLSGTSR